MRAFSFLIWRRGPPSMLKLQNHQDITLFSHLSSPHDLQWRRLHTHSAACKETHSGTSSASKLQSSDPTRECWNCHITEANPAAFSCHSCSVLLDKTGPSDYYQVFALYENEGRSGRG